MSEARLTGRSVLVERKLVLDQGSQASTKKTRLFEYEFCVDSGATAVCIPDEDIGLLGSIQDADPDIGLEVANGRNARSLRSALSTLGED